jgi:hypothetical protein
MNPSGSSIPFAKIDDISNFADSDGEILLSMNSVFRIEQIDNQLWQINLTLRRSDTNPQLKCLTGCIRHEIENQKSIT